MTAASTVSWLLPLSLGLVLGLRHAVDPDHVIAVSTMVSREQSLGRSARFGALWGVGHGLTIMLVGGAIILFGLTVPRRLELLLELGVATMLVVLGVANVIAMRRHVIKESSRLAPVAIGFVHGLAGSAAVALLVLTTVASPMYGILYLLIFGIGTILGMVCVTLALALPMRTGLAGLPRMRRGLQLAFGTLSILFGILMMHEIGMVQGLFAGILGDWFSVL